MLFLCLILLVSVCSPGVSVVVSLSASFPVSCLVLPLVLHMLLSIDFPLRESVMSVLLMFRDVS